MYLKQLKWTQHDGTAAHPPYDEANISELFQAMIDPINESLNVTIRKYPRMYNIAYSYTNVEDEEPDFDYTGDGDGDGIIPGPTIIHVIARLPHHDLETHWDTIILKLRRKIAESEGIWLTQ